MKSLFVAVTDSPAGDDLSVEREVLVNLRVEKVTWQDQQSLIAAVRDADAILCMHAPFTEMVIRALSRCRIISRFGTGLDNIDQQAAQAANIQVAGVTGYCTGEVADHTMALLLAWHRKLLAYDHFVREMKWNEKTYTTGNWGCGPLYRLTGKTLGIVGFGRIGQAVARRALAFGMKILVHTRHQQEMLASQIGVEFVSLEGLLRKSDYVSLHVPLAPETQHFINAETIKIMKPGAVLMNTSRGALIEERALADALRTGHLGGALLDVYEQAPLPVEHPFRNLNNLILTPHVGFYSEDALAELRRKAAESVLIYFQADASQARLAAPGAATNGFW